MKRGQFVTTIDINFKWFWEMPMICKLKFHFHKSIYMNSVVIQNLTQITKNFEAEKGLFKGPNFETWVFGLKMNPPPPSEFFQKFICFGNARHPVLAYQQQLFYQKSRFTRFTWFTRYTKMQTNSIRYVSICFSTKNQGLPGLPG